MPVRKRPKERQCKRCGKVYTSLMRLKHHRAAEHAPRISRDIYTTHDIPHQPKVIPVSISTDAV